MRITCLLFLCAAIAIIPTACSINPGYEERLEVWETRITELEGTERSLKNEIIQVREGKQATAALVSELQDRLAQSEGSAQEVIDGLTMDLESAEQQWAIHQVTLEGLKEQRALAEGERRAARSGLNDFKIESLGQSAGSAMGWATTLIGLLAAGGATWAGKAMGVVNAMKSAPSRAQGAVDELWDDARGRGEEVAVLKEKLSQALARLDAQVNQPQQPPLGNREEWPPKA